MSSTVSTTYLKSNKKVIKAAQDIFGEDMIKNAYYTYKSYKREGEDNAAIAKKLYQIPKMKGYSKDNPKLNIDRGDGVIIEFTNGKAVEFSTSEWGSICFSARKA